MNWPRLKDCSISELEEMAKAIKMEMDSRDEARFKELSKIAADALNVLRMEYPWVSYDINCGCEACGESVEVNIFDAVDRFEASRFRR